MKIIDLAFQNITEGDRQKLEQSRVWSKALVVPETHSAQDVAEVVDLNDMNIVVVVDKDNAVKGVVVPNIVIKSAPAHLQLASKPKDFAGVVSEIVKHRREKTDFDWLKTERPQVYWCAAGNHWTDEMPCPDHPQ